MKKTVNDYLPVHEKVFIQARIPIDLFEKVKEIMDKTDYSWADILTAALRRFLDEVEIVEKVKSNRKRS